jgi:Predicted Zn-dependent hydrolases of the beta-lactamase fold
MKITFINHACFLIEGKDQSFVIDPFDNSYGPIMPTLSADYLLISHEHHDHNNRAAITISQQDFPSNVRIVDSFHDNENGAKRGTNKIHVIDIDGKTICHLGDLGQILTDEQLVEIGKVDVLLIPVGGTYTVDAEQAIAICEQIKPKTIVPMHYKTPEITLDLAPIDDFIRLANQKNLNLTIINPKETIIV